MKKKQLVILANKYPNEFDPNINVFTQQTAWTFADLGYECVVVCPSAVNLNKTNRKLPSETIETTEQGNSVRIVRPHYMSMGQRPGPFNKQRVAFTVAHYIGATEKALREYSIDPALFFGEFLCPCGVAAAKLGKARGTPTFYPNGCRGDRFYPRDRRKARLKMGWPEDLFVVGLTGSFDERKGVMRLKSAVETMDGVYYACAGKGPLDPSGAKCLLSSPIDNADLPWFLSALDAFVLPTQNEGCCTATVEAISCGLPIVSADRSFNYDICDESNSILVDPNDIRSITAAIARLRDDDELRAHLAKGSLDRSSSLDLKKRVASIVEWMDEKTGGAVASSKRA